MKRFWGHVMTVAVTGLIASAAMPACAENDQSIFIARILAPPASRTNGVCLYLPDPTAPFLSSGELDVGIRDNYMATMLVGGQLISRADPQAPIAETNRIHLNGVTVRVETPDGASVGEFTADAAGFVDVSNGTAATFGLIAAPIVDAPTAAKLAAQLPNASAIKTVITFVKVFGKTLGGVDVETGEYQFPLQVCNGCLVSFLNASDPTRNPPNNCLKDLDTAATLPCLAGQDELTPCQLCRGARPVCTTSP